MEWFLEEILVVSVARVDRNEFALHEKNLVFMKPLVSCAIAKSLDHLWVWCVAISPLAGNGHVGAKFAILLIEAVGQPDLSITKVRRKTKVKQEMKRKTNLLDNHISAGDVGYMGSINTVHVVGPRNNK